MAPPHLLMFDVDGTLVQTLGVEAVCFPRACEEALGLARVSNDWSAYRHPSDAGIVAELVERHCVRRASAADQARVEARFLALLKDAFSKQPALCREVPGAKAAFQRTCRLASTVVAIATAGWSSTARCKLSTAGFDIGNLPLASSHDALSKEAIMRIGLARALRHAGVSHFSSLTYVGDSARDARAAAVLGFHFIGIDTSGFVRETPHRFEDFSDSDAFIATVLNLRENAESAQTHRPDPRPAA